MTRPEARQKPKKLIMLCFKNKAAEDSFKPIETFIKNLQLNTMLNIRLEKLIDIKQILQPYKMN
jgi:hypothetical protein